MASYNELNALIDAYINRNGVQAITGQILNGVLKAMVEQLGRGYTIMGAATPTTDPGTPDGPECYFASETGTYTDFDGLQVVPGELALLCYTPSDGWTKATIYEGFRQVGATIDGNVGTPSVGVSYADGVLSFDFHNMKGNPGQNGQDGAAAGFGSIGADITGGVGTPGVTVESSGPATAKNLQFHFTNLKGETGVTSVVATVDNTSGTPSCAVSLQGQQLTLAFTGLKGAQGNTGVSADYPIAIINNLTTDDPASALSAAQGVVLDGKVSQLEAKVNELEPEVEQLKTGNYTEEGGTEQLVFSATNKVEHIAAPANGTSFITSPYFDGYYYLATKNMSVDYRIRASFTNWHIVVSDTLPASGVSYTGIAKGTTAGDTGSFNVNAGQYICVISNYAPTTNSFPILTTKLYETTNVVSLSKANRNQRISTLAPTYFHGVRLVDTLTRQRWGKSTNTKIGNFTPVSATADTITLSAEDAACIVNTVILSCKFANGDYKNIYFSAASGNVITKLYDFGENLDCQNIVQMQSLHDTINGGQGIHLSPFGYRAMAQNIYNDLQTKKPFSDVFVGGWSAQFCKGSTTYNDARIVDANGNEICTPAISGITPGGAVNRCEMVYARSVPALEGGPFYITYYDIAQQNANGATATFRLNSLYPFKGFLRVNCCRYPTYNGAVNLIVKDFEGNTLATQSVAPFADSYIFYLDTVYYEGVDVIVQMPDNDTSGIKITEMTLHETYVELPQIRAIDSKSVVAMLGSSNTQFPGLTTAEALCPGDADNSIVERPDGTMGDGCGYFGKELARVSGATVDNWGKSGEQTPYGLDIIQKVFATKRYTHIVLSLFANDSNANRPWSEIISNIRMMAEYAKGHGCIPIVVMGYAVNGTGIAYGYALMYEDLTQGMDSPFIYTSAEYHRG